jgi:TolB protein
MTGKKSTLRSRLPKVTAFSYLRFARMKRSTRFLLAIAIPLLFQACAPSLPSATPAQTKQIPSPTPTSTSTDTQTPTASATSTQPLPLPTLPPGSNEYFVLSLADNGYQHLFIYSPQAVPLYRITDGTWDDITPAISPDGKQIAFASRRNGYFDIYILNLGDGTITRVTDSLAYDASPSWSPDGQFLVYETYENGNLEIKVQSAVDPSQLPIKLTNDAFLDHSPVWSPLGRQVAFVSNRSGNDDIWVANLNEAGSGQFVNVSNSPLSQESYPTWSGDGTLLAWYSSGGDSSPGIYTFKVAQTGSLPLYLGTGDQPVWSSNTDQIATRLTIPNGNYLTAYDSQGLLTLPPILLTGPLNGFSLGKLVLPIALPETIQQAALDPTPVWTPVLENSTKNLPPGRIGLVPLEDVKAPFPQLNDLTDESFAALRKRLVHETGWDVLANLENAFVPLTSPSDPALGQDWIYTGRAFTLNPVLLNANWLLVVREEFGNDIYWKVFLRSTAQDGSQGEPLTDLPWDLNARYNLDPITYDQGGKLMDKVPAGYWVNLTELASRFGWERLPALSIWRTYFKGTRFNEFALTAGLDWEQAMLEVYPPEVLTTPTVVVPPTFTPTRTPWGYKTPTVTRTPTPRPTFTTAP